MAKRRRRQAKPQARPSARELRGQQQASAKRLVESPFFRSLQEHNRQLRDSPLGRRMIEDALIGEGADATPDRRHARAQRRPDGRPANQGGIEAPACSFIMRRRFAHHRSIAFSAARIASRLAPSIEPSRGLGGV
jgi:hypothetical protein